MRVLAYFVRVLARNIPSVGKLARPMNRFAKLIIPVHCRDNSLVITRPFVLLASLFLFVTVTNAIAAEPIVTTSSSADELIMRYSEYPTLLEDPDPLTVTIYGDGRVRKHNPRYWKTAGEYELYLTSRELRQLLNSAAKAGVLDFDERKARREKRSIHKAKNEARKARRKLSRQQRVSSANSTLSQPEEIFYVSDGEAMELDISVRRYVNADGKLKMSHGKKAIRWRRLQIDATELPEHRQIQGLARYEKRIKAIIERNDFVQVSNGN